MFEEYAKKNSKRQDELLVTNKVFEDFKVKTKDTLSDIKKQLRNMEHILLEGLSKR